MSYYPKNSIILFNWTRFKHINNILVLTYQSILLKNLLSVNKYILRYKGTILLGIIFIILSNIFRVFQPQAIRQALDLIIIEIKKPQEQVHAEYLATVLMKFGLLILFYAIVMGVFMYFMRQTIIVMSRKVEYDLRKSIFDHYLQLDSKFYRQNKTGDIMSRITEDVNKVRMYLGPVVLYGINLIALFAVVIITMFKVNFWLSVYTLVPLPFLSFIIYYVSNKINKSSEKIQIQLAKLTNISQEAFSGIRILKSSNSSNHTIDYFNSESEIQKKLSLQLSQIDAMFFPSMFLMIGLSSLITLYIGGLSVFQNNVTAGNIAEFVLYTNMLTWPVSAIGWCASMIQQAEASQKRINEFLNTKKILTAGTLEINDEASLNISFSNVDYQYSGDHSPTLKNISLEINQNEKIAIVGKTGSGKTTLIDLLQLNALANSGNIKFNNTPITEYSLHSIRKNISVVPQDNFLFSDTINENLKLSKPNASNQEIEIACRNAALLDEIKEIPNGFEAILGERGVSLSGGQKQRLALARAFLRESKLLILDDSLSAIDAETEHRIMTYIDQKRSQSLLLITHRIDQTKQMDRIYVIDNGRIVAEGTFDALLQSNTLFQELYNSNSDSMN